jgi:membrane protease YdiL (CAAX protease family)
MAGARGWSILSLALRAGRSAGRGWFHRNSLLLECGPVQPDGKYVMHLSLGAVFGLLGSVVMLAYFRTMRHSFVYGGVAHPKLALPIAVGAAIVNSFWEEHVWRNLPRLLLSESTSYIYLIVSAASFGIAHLSAWPHTLAFVALATLFGLISAYIVLTRQSLIPSFVAHVIVDVILLRYQIKS